MRVLVGGLLLGLLGCRHIDATSGLKHEINHPVLDNTPYQWTTMTETEYRTILEFDVQSEFDVKGDPIVPASYPALKRIQFHMDQIDGMLRKKYPSQLANIPKPVAHLILVSDVNANVTPTSLCSGRAISIADAGNSGPSRFWEFNRETGQFVSDPNPESPVLCLRKKWTTAEAQNALSWNLQSTDGCSAKTSGSGAQLSAGCARLFDPPLTVASAADTSLIVIPNAVTFYGGMLHGIPEEQLVFWIGHELGHYYRAHPVQPPRTFDIYYSLGERNPTKRPTEDAQVKDFADRMRPLQDIVYQAGLKGLSAPQKKDWQALNQEALERGIGFYTDEQEADELGLEWITEYGIDPEVSIAALLDFLSLDSPHASASDAAADWSYARCKAAFDKDWVGMDGAPVIVPIGESGDEHHSNCYRAYNLMREIKTHQYTVSAPKPALLPDAEWQAMQKAVKEDMAKLKF